MFWGARLDVLIFRLRSYHVLISYSAECNGPKFYKTLTFLGQAGMFLSFQARCSSAMRSSTSDLTVDSRTVSYYWSSSVQCRYWRKASSTNEFISVTVWVHFEWIIVSNDHAYSELAFWRTQNFRARLGCSQLQATFLSYTFLSNWAVNILLDVIFPKKNDVLKPRLA